MDTTKSTSRYILTTLAIIIVITAFILVGLNALHLEGRLATASFNKAGSTQLNAKYVEGYLAARQKYQTMCPFAAQPAYLLYGTVENINNSSSLTVLQDSLDSDELVDHVSNRRVITTTSDTTITRSTAKPQEQFLKEMSDFNASRSAGTLGLTPPSPVVEQAIKLSDIPLGTRIRVESDQDIRSLESFPATRISVTQE